MSDASVASFAPQAATKKEWLGLAVLVLPTILLALDMTVLHLAVPHLSKALQPSSVQLLWILDIYGFMIAGFLIVMGSLGDSIGRRRLLLIGAVAFGITSVIAAFSTSATMLIITRALLGIAGATLMPSTLSLIRNMFQVESERTRAISVWMTGFIVGGAIGPIVGGFLLEYYWWGSVFLLAVPVMVFLIIAGVYLLPEYRDEKATSIDYISALQLVLAMLFLVYALKDIVRHGISMDILLVSTTGIGLMLVFLRRQTLLAQPFLDLSLFSNRLFSAAVATSMLTIMTLSGFWLMVYQFLQGVVMLSPLQSALVMLPAAILQVIVAQIVPLLFTKVRPIYPITYGLLLAIMGFLLVVWAGMQASAVLLGVAAIVMGVGVMPIMIMTTDLVVGSVPEEKASTASAVSETANELGIALGVAIIGSLASWVYQQEIGAYLSALLTANELYTAMATLAGGIHVAGAVSVDLSPYVLSVVQTAFSQAMEFSAYFAAVILSFTTCLAIRAFRSLKPIA